MTEPTFTKLTRRRFLKAGAAAAGAGPLAAHVGVAAANDGKPPYTQPFLEALPVYKPKQAMNALYPPAQEHANVAQGEAGRAPHQRWQELWPSKFYELRVSEALHSFHPHLPRQKIWGYDGTLPGPTIAARYGEPVVVRIHNMLNPNHVGFGSPEISTHLHNLHCASESDGYAGDYYGPTKKGPTLTAPGRYLDHHYPNRYAGYDKYPATQGDPREAQGTLWYHDHRLDFTAANIFRGLCGFYLLFDRIDSGNENDPYRNHPDPSRRALCLPSGVGVYDIPLALQELHFDSSGYLSFNPFDKEGEVGNKSAVNGKIQPYFNVARRKYRFRLLNASILNFYELYLVHQDKDREFTFIASDGNLLPAPLKMTKVNLAPAERADIVIDFRDYPLGTQLHLVNRSQQEDGRGPSPFLLQPGTPVLRFVVDRDAPDPSRVPDKLRDLPDLPADLSRLKVRKWKFDRENDFWTVNSRLFDVYEPRAKIRIGSEEIWELESNGSWTHPVHIHMEEGRILTRNGKPPPPHERGRKDMYVLHPGDVVRVFIRFRDFTGKYMMHCHNAVHEDHAMMVRFDVESD